MLRAVHGEGADCVSAMRLASRIPRGREGELPCGAVPKRRLPVLQNTEDPDEPPRPGWQWVGFGALAIIAVWVPLSAVVGAVAARLLVPPSDGRALGRAALLVSGAYIAELAMGAFAGGYLVGKWGPARVGVRHAALAGLAAASALAAATCATLGPTLGGGIAILVLAPATAAVGGRIGTRRRGG